MQQTTYIEITSRALEFLSNIQAPVPVADFIQLELTGNPEADSLLSSISLMMLDYLRNSGMIEADDLKATDAKIYGLTPQGVQMHQLFLQLSKA